MVTRSTEPLKGHEEKVSGAHRRHPFHCRLLCLRGEMTVHTLFEIYFELRLNFKDISARGVELFV